MKVQQVRLDQDRLTWLVLDDNYRPVQPLLSYLQFLDQLGRSPNTVRNAAHHLKLFWEYLSETDLVWADIDVSHLAAFILWLRRNDQGMVSIEPLPVRRTNATIDQVLSTVHGLYDFHVRMKTVPELPLYRFLATPNRRYKPFLYGIAKTKPVQARVVRVKREKRRVKVLAGDQVGLLLSACEHFRDKFLLTLLYETGMRIGQALGLRHEDICVEDGELIIVPRDNNANRARAKTREAYTIPLLTSLLQLYTDYLIEDLGALEIGTLPDYVFVNLWEGQVGQPLSYEAVMSLVKRLRKKTGVHFTPHMLRHTRATQWIRDDKLSLETVARLLGHASVETTHAAYVHLTAQDLRRALKREPHDVSES